MIGYTHFPTSSEAWHGTGLDAEGVYLTVFRGRCRFPGGAVGGHVPI